MRDQTLLTDVQYAVVEPPNGGASWPSGLWTRDEVLGYLNQRQDRLLKQTLIAMREVTIPVGLPQVGSSRFDLPADWLRTISVFWFGSNGVVRELMRSDTFEADHALPDWLGADDPLVYMELETDHRVFQVGPAPPVTGDLLVLYTPAGTPLTGNGVSLTVADELAPAIKYGLLADLLGKDGRGQDRARAQYAEQRFQLGVDAARLILEGWA